MKKIIALLLAMALCLGLFVGCDGDAQVENTGLADAKAYLEAMYHDESETTAVDYSRVGVVMIDGVSYTVTWTSSVESITVTPADKMVKIELPDTLEDIAYTLTATIADADGNTETVAFERMVPAAAGLPTSIADGTYVILSCGNLTMSSLTEDKGYGYPTATEVTVADGAVSGHKIADVLTIKNVDGGVTIQDAYGRYFYLKGTYNSFNVSAEAPAEGHVWEVLKNGDDYLIVNAMNKKTLAYDSNYKSWGAYPELGDTHNYLLAIVSATAPSEDTPTPDVPETPVDKQLPPVSEPAADTAYKFGCIQVGTGNTVYIAGGIDQERYLITTTDKAAALDVYAEAVEGGYKFSTTIDGNKVYIALYMNDAGKTALGYTAEGTVFAYDATLCCWFTNVDGTDYYIGTYGTFETLSASKTSYITAENTGVSQYPAGFFAVDGEDAPVTPDEPATPEAPATLADAIAEASKLANKEYLSYEISITGTITDDPQVSSYTADQYKFTVSDGTNTLLCYYTTVTGGTPKKGDTVTVTGCLTAYNGSAQFDSKATAVLAGGSSDNNETTGGATATDVTLANGMKVVIYAPAHGKALSSLPSSEGSYYQLGVDVAMADGKLTGYADTEVWTVIVNDDGSVSFQQGGQNLGMQESYSSMSLGAVNDDWKVISLGNGLYLIQNTVRENCIEWYSSKNNWSTYTTTADAGNDLFHMAFYVVE